MKRVQDFDYFDWYAVVVLCVGSAWRSSVAWSLRGAVGLSVITLAVGIMPYVAFVKLSRSLRSKWILAVAASLVLAEDIHVRIVLNNHHGPRDDLALVAYPLFVAFWVFFVDSIVCSIRKRARK